MVQFMHLGPKIYGVGISLPVGVVRKQILVHAPFDLHFFKLLKVNAIHLILEPEKISIILLNVGMPLLSPRRTSRMSFTNARWLKSF